MNKRKTYRFMPLWLALSVVVGIFVGTFFANRFTGNRLSIINSGSNKLNDLLHIIDDQYVDTVNMGELVETAMPQILSDHKCIRWYSYICQWKKLQCRQTCDTHFGERA